jgi:hypothetical protein
MSNKRAMTAGINTGFSTGASAQKGGGHPLYGNDLSDYRSKAALRGQLGYRDLWYRDDVMMSGPRLETLLRLGLARLPELRVRVDKYPGVDGGPGSAYEPPTVMCAALYRHDPPPAKPSVVAP